MPPPPPVQVLAQTEQLRVQQADGVTPIPAKLPQEISHIVHCHLHGPSSFESAVPHIDSRESRAVQSLG